MSNLKSMPNAFDSFHTLNVWKSEIAALMKSSYTTWNGATPHMHVRIHHNEGQRAHTSDELARLLVTEDDIRLFVTKQGPPILIFDGKLLAMTRATKTAWVLTVSGFMSREEMASGPSVLSCFYETCSTYGCTVWGFGFLTERTLRELWIQN